MLLLATLPLILSSGGLASADAPLGRALERAQVRLERASILAVDHSEWDNAWEIESEHYLVRTTANWYIGKRVAQNLENMFSFFSDVTGTDWQPNERLQVFLFEDLGDYNVFGDSNGEHHSSILGSYHATAHPQQPVATYLHHSQLQVGQWVTHSAFHQFVTSAFSRPLPVWFEEGLASYFARAYWDKPFLISEFKRISNSEAYVPLGTLLREPIEEYVADPHVRFVELGTLFTYLLHHRPDTMTQKNADGVVLMAPMGDYVLNTLRGQDVTDNPVHELLTQDLDQLEAELRDFANEF